MKPLLESKRPVSSSVAATVGPSDVPLRICHVSLALKTGGLERLLADFARCHDRSQSEMEFVAIRETGRFADVIRATDCPVHLLRPARRWGQVAQMAKLFRAGRFDVVHTHNTYPHLYASLAARWAGVPVVIQTRHGQRAGHGWKSRLQYRWASKLVDRVVAVSHDAAKLTVEGDGLPSTKVCTIWNGIDLDDFEYRGANEFPVAISVARLSAEKDFPTLLRAVRLAVDQVPNLTLRLIGDGPERAQLETLCRELDLCGCVEFHGDCRDVPHQLSQAGFFVSSSLTEGISLTLLEAMAVGLPVIATAVGGNPEIIEDGITGRLAPAGDAEQLARLMVEFCQHSENRNAMGRAGRLRVEQHFDVRRMVHDYQALYAELTAAHRHSISTKN